MGAVFIRFGSLLAALFLAAYLFPGVEALDFPSLLLVAVFLGLINVLVRPVIMLFAFPVNFLTLGLFGFTFNVGALWFASSLVDGYVVDGFFPALAAAAVVSATGLLSRRLLRGRRQGRARVDRA